MNTSMYVSCIIIYPKNANENKKSIDNNTN